MKRTSTALFLILGLFAITAFGQKQPALKDRHAATVAEIAAAERAFAKRCGEVGLRDSFVENFADNCIIFIPEPVNGKEFYGKRPSGKGPNQLVWGPEFVDASNGGEMGYSTGPSVFSNPADPKFKPRYGYYFSIWRKQADGTWKVEVDVGTPTPNGNPIPRDVESGRFFGGKELPKAGATGTNWPAALAVETEFAKVIQAKGVAAGYAKFTSDQFRRHFPNLMPLKGGDALQSHLGERTDMTLHVTNANSSTSGDMYYCYGDYSASVNTGKETKKETGFFFHVWKQEGKSLKLVAEVLSLKE